MNAERAAASESAFRTIRRTLAFYARGKDEERAQVLLDEIQGSLTALRDAWNAHMETCPQREDVPSLPVPTWDELEAWRNAKSGTASAFALTGDPNFDPKGDDELSV